MRITNSLICFLSDSREDRVQRQDMKSPLPGLCYTMLHGERGAGGKCACFFFFFAVSHLLKVLQSTQSNRNPSTA